MIITEVLSGWVLSSVHWYLLILQPHYLCFLYTLTPHTVSRSAVTMRATCERGCQRAYWRKKRGMVRQRKNARADRSHVTLSYFWFPSWESFPSLAAHQTVLCLTFSVSSHYLIVSLSPSVPLCSLSFSSILINPIKVFISSFFVLLSCFRISSSTFLHFHLFALSLVLFF